MKFPAVIICLLAVACVRNTMSHVSRQIRQVPTTLPAPAVPSTNYNNTQTPYPYPTYPVYLSNVNQIGQSTAPVTNVPQTITTISPSTNSTSLLDTSTSKSFLQHARTYGIYALQVLMVVLLGTSLLNYICLQWPICDKVFGENNFWKNNKVKQNIFIYSFFSFWIDLKTLSKFE